MKKSNNILFTVLFSLFLNIPLLGQVWNRSNVAVQVGTNVKIFNNLVYVLDSQNGELLKSTNGGSNWDRIQTDINTPYNFFFLNENEGWIINTRNPAQVYRTGNGRQNWNLVSELTASV